MKRLDITDDRDMIEGVLLDEARKEEIINSLLPFIKYTALRLSYCLPPQLSVEDLISAGIAGLLESLNRYREELGSLEAFVKQRIRDAMIDELRANSNFSRGLRDKLSAIRNVQKELEGSLGRMPEAEEIAEGLNITIDEYYRILNEMACSITLRLDDFTDARYDDELNLHESIPDRNIKTPERLYEEKRLKEMIASFIERLPEKEKLVLSLYYWDELTMKEIARVLGITEGRVSQLHNQAITRFKAYLIEIENG
ncbi:MAG: FliA/WhiG family RNA polymerase sigma factor [Thermodesulfovibrionales bacterium]